MPNFTFKISSIKKKNSSNTENIIETKCDGIVIKVENHYYVVYNGKQYDITLDSYKCKGKKIIYLRQKNKYIKIIRDGDNRPNMPNMYIPFKENLKVKGCIIRSNFKDTFKIISSYNSASQEEFDEALKEMKQFNK